MGDLIPEDVGENEMVCTGLMDESTKSEIFSLKVNMDQQAHRIRMLEKMLDTRASPLWRRIVFRLDGWPSWATVSSRPSWRPWHRWWRS